MLDSYGRNIDYLRLSVTESCNLRCRYCVPENFLPCNDIMTESEILCAVRSAVSVGIMKVRITGGEPLMRADILSVCEGIAGIPGVRELCITTNGTFLAGMAEALRRSGVQNVNISLDTLDPQRYEYLTRGGSIAHVLAGIEAAVSAGFEKVKVNAVLIGGFNDDEIERLAGLSYEFPVDVRFIELMPSGFCGQNDFVSCDEVLKRLPGAVSSGCTRSVHTAALPGEGTAELYHLPGALGNIGLIRTVSRIFCPNCRRIRLTYDGKIKPCLHSSEEIDIKGMSEEGMKNAFARAVMMKPPVRPGFFLGRRTMNMIGG